MANETNVVSTKKKMGSGASQLNQGLKCPADYNAKDFEAICMLFDKFDTNGDLIVSGSELAHIANVHVENNIDNNWRKVENLQKKKVAIQSQGKTRLAVEINAITLEIDASIDRNVTLVDKRIEGLKKDIGCWEIATPAQKHDCFVKVISKDNRVSFPEFFKYMRSRVQDMRKHYIIN